MSRIQERSIRRLLAVVLGLMFTIIGVQWAAAEEPSAGEVNKANNPIASVIAFNIQDYYTPKSYGTPSDFTRNTSWFRLAVPLWRTLTRVSLPLQTTSTASPTEASGARTGLGDLNIFTAFTLTPDTWNNILALGPIYVAPTATDDALGANHHQLGLAALYIFKFETMLGGALVTWQHNVTESTDEDPVSNVLTAQLFSTWQLGGGTYLRTAPTWVFDLETGDYNIPMGFGIGQVLKVKNVIYNIFIEPQFTMLHEGVGQPALQIYTALNMQFPTGATKSKKEEVREAAQSAPTYRPMGVRTPSIF